MNGLATLQAQLSPATVFRKENLLWNSLSVSLPKKQLAHVHVQQLHIRGAKPQLRPNVGTPDAELHNLGMSLEQRR